MLQTLEKQKSTVGEMNLQIIGRLFWCCIPGKNIWTRTHFEDAMQQAGVPIEASPALSNRSDFIRALRTMEQDRLIRFVKEDKEELVFQSTSELQDGIGLSYQREAVITLDKAKATIEATDPDFARAVRDAVGNQSDIYDGNDLRRVVTRLLSQHGKSIKPRSGVHFVPEAKAHWISTIQNFLGILGVTETGEFPLPDVSEVKTQIEKAHSLQARKAIKELSQEINELKKSGVSTTILQRKFKKINELKAKANLYSDALEIESEEISNALETLTLQLRRALLY